MNRRTDEMVVWLGIVSAVAVFIGLVVAFVI